MKHEYVTHPTLRAEELTRNRVAHCQHGLHQDFNMSVYDIQADGKFRLQLSHFIPLPANDQGRGLISEQKWWPDQHSVSKIKAVEGDCVLSRLGFEFALIEDKQSEGFLGK